MRIIAALLALSAACLLGACGGSSKPIGTGPTSTTLQSASTSTTTSALTQPTTTLTVPSTVTSPTTAVPVAPCVASKLKGSFLIIPGSEGAGQVYARVVLTNISSLPCRTFGYVGMQLLGASDTPLPTNVVRLPATEQRIVLAPGQSASALAHFSPDIPGSGDNQQAGEACQPVAQGTEITPPDDTNFVVAPGLMSSVCEKGTIQLQPLVPGANAGP